MGAPTHLEDSEAVTLFERPRTLRDDGEDANKNGKARIMRTRKLYKRRGINLRDEHFDFASDEVGQ